MTMTDKVKNAAKPFDQKIDEILVSLQGMGVADGATGTIEGKEVSLRELVEAWATHADDRAKGSFAAIATDPELQETLEDSLPGVSEDGTKLAQNVIDQMNADVEESLNPGPIMPYNTMMEISFVIREHDPAYPVLKRTVEELLETNENAAPGSSPEWLGNMGGYFDGSMDPVYDSAIAFWYRNDLATFGFYSGYLTFSGAALMAVMQATWDTLPGQPYDDLVDTLGERGVFQSIEGVRKEGEMLRTLRKKRSLGILAPASKKKNRKAYKH